MPIELAALCQFFSYYAAFLLYGMPIMTRLREFRQIDPLTPRVIVSNRLATPLAFAVMYATIRQSMVAERNNHSVGTFERSFVVYHIEAKWTSFFLIKLHGYATFVYIRSVLDSFGKR